MKGGEQKQLMESMVDRKVTVKSDWGVCRLKVVYRVWDEEM